VTTYALPTLSRSAPPSVEWGLKSNTQVFTSPLNGAVQTMELIGARWTASFTWQNLDEADASDLQAVLLQARGQANRLSQYAYHRPVPRGTIALASVTLGASVAQLANSCTLNGCGAGATILAGDYISVAGELKMITADATANGSGVATGVTFEPMVRAVAGWSSGASVTTNKPTATFILADPHVRWTTGRALRTDVPVDLVEVW
jgi:hypothetical protein